MLFRVVKLEARTALENDNSPMPLSRVATATSEGELIRVGTLGVRVVFESRGNTRYISATTSEILGAPLVPGTIRPTNDAVFIKVREPRTKSSPASISKPLVSGRVATPIKLLGVRLLKMSSPKAGAVSNPPAAMAISH